MLWLWARDRTNRKRTTCLANLQLRLEQAGFFGGDSALIEAAPIIGNIDFQIAIDADGSYRCETRTGMIIDIQQRLRNCIGDGFRKLFPSLCLLPARTK